MSVIWSILKTAAGASPAQVQQFLQSRDGQAMRTWIQTNLTAPQPDATQKLEMYRAYPLTWAALQQAVAESYPAGMMAFEQHLSGPEEAALQAPQGQPVPGQQANPAEQQPQDEYADEADDAKADSSADGVVAQMLEEIEQMFTSNPSNRAWMSDIARNNQGDKKKSNRSSLAEVIYDAPYNFFTKNKKGGVKKWKYFFMQNPGLLPAAVKQILPTVKNDVKKAIDKEIVQSYMAGNDPAIITTLRELAGGDSGQANEALLKAILSSANSLTFGQAQHGMSLNYSPNGADGGRGTQIGDMIADPKAAPPSDVVGTLSGPEENTMIGVAKEFLESASNGPFFNQIINLANEEGEVMLARLPDDIADEILMDSVYNAMTGFNDDAVAHWKGFFFRNENLLPPQFQQIPMQKREDAMSQHVAELAPILNQLATSGDQRLQTFLRPIMAEFISQKFDEKRLNRKKGDLNSLVRNLGRLSKVVKAYLKKDLEWNKVNSPGVGEVNATRRTALLGAKSDMAIGQISDLLNGKREIVPFGNGKVIRNPQGKLIIRMPGSGARELNVDTFDQVERLVSPTAWAPQAIDRMQKMDPRSLAKSFNKGRTWTKLTQPLDDATDQHIQQNGWQGDYLAGWRQQIAKNLQEQMQRVGKTPEMLIQAFKEQQTAGRGRTVGTYIRTNTAKFISDIVAGRPTLYTLQDINIIGQLLGLPSTTPAPVGQPMIKGKPFPLSGKEEPWHFNEFFETAKYYDRYSVKDHTDLNEQVGNAFRTYGPYLVHRQRQAARAGVREAVFDKNTMYMFLSMMRLHNQFSTQHAPQVGKILYELVDKPIGVKTDKDKDKSVTMDEIKERIKYDTKGKEVGDVDPYENMLPEEKRIYPNKGELGPGPDGKAPDYVRKHFEPSMGDYTKNVLRDESGKPVKLDYWQQKTLGNLQQISNDPTNPNAQHAKQNLDRLTKQLPTMSFFDKVKAFVPPKYRKRHINEHKKWEPVRDPNKPGQFKFDSAIIDGFFKTMDSICRLASVRNSLIRYAGQGNYATNDMIDEVADSYINFVLSLGE